MSDSPSAPRWMKPMLRVAGVYNVVFGIWAVVWPEAYFRFAGMPVPSLLELWQCVGMVVGVYGVGYWIAGSDPFRHWPIVLVGFLGKVFGPIGFVQSLVKGSFTLKAGLLNVMNDVIWWVPFALVLLGAWRHHHIPEGMKKSRATSGVMTLPTEARQIAELFESLEDVQFWIKNRAHRYLHANRAFLLNYDLIDVSQVLGKTDFDLSPAFLADQFVADDEQVLAGHRVVNRIELVGGADQAPHWNVTNKLPLRDARGRITGTAGTTRQLKDDARGIVGAHGFEAVLLRIRDGYRKHLPNGELAAQAGLSVRAFERRFLQSFHVTPQQYVRKLRVRMACRALVFTDKSLADVAIEAGFADQSHLGHEFRRHTGRTPRGYREHYRARED